MYNHFVVRIWDVRPFAPQERCVKIFQGHQHTFEKVVHFTAQFLCAERECETTEIRIICRCFVMKIKYFMVYVKFLRTFICKVLYCRTYWSAPGHQMAVRWRQVPVIATSTFGTLLHVEYCISYQVTPARWMRSISIPQSQLVCAALCCGAV